MGSLVDKIRSQKYTYEFEELDEQSIRKKLNIYTKAKENGKIEKPPSDANNIDDVENEIINCCRYGRYQRGCNLGSS